MRNVFIQTEHLTKRFGSHCAIENLVFEVEPGEIFGYLGPSGAGKSTTIRTLLGLTRPTSGSATVLGLDIVHASQAIHRRVGYLPQNSRFYNNLTPWQMLTYLGGLQGSFDRTHAARLAERFNLRLDRPIRTLDSGSRKKIALVQTFMHRPEVVFLDEPSAGLDAAALAVLIQLIGEVRADGRSVFFATSNPAEVERTCDRVAILCEGQVRAVERVVQFKSRALRRVEIRFAGPVTLEPFTNIPNVHDLSLERSVLRCTVKGEPDLLIKAAGQFRITDMISRETNLEEVFSTFYSGVPYAA